MPSNVAAPTKRSLEGVWTTRTAWPALMARRASSTDLYAAIPPVTPRRILAMAAPYPLPAVAVLDLVGCDLLEGDLQVVLGVRLDHRRRVLVERPLAEVVVVRVDLAGSLRGHDDRRVVRVDLREQRVEAWLDHFS